jgi:hypothetical protein
MKTFVWLVFAFFALLWTGGAYLTVEAVQWAARVVSSGEATDLAQAAAQWPVPAWLAPWVDAAWLHGIQQAIVASLTALRGSMPALGSAVGWLVPAVWIVWAIGMIGLLLIVAVALFLVRRASGATKHVA